MTVTVTAVHHYYYYRNNGYYNYYDYDYCHQPVFGYSRNNELNH